MGKIIVTGSIAYDTIMQFDDEFQTHILPDQLDKLSVSFLVKNMEKYPGGTAQNAAYTLGLLGLKNETILLGAVGKDFVADLNSKEYIDYSHIFYDKNLYTATGNMIGDVKNNQITTFYIGAMDSADKQSINDVSGEKEYLLVYANQKSAMQKFIKEAYDNNISSFFCPGQSLPLRSKEELLEVSKQANYLVCNEYEINLFTQKTGLEGQDIIKLFDKVIVTLGEKGVKLCDNTCEDIVHGVVLDNVVDPTGAGDAFLAALVSGLQKNMSRNTALKFANILASFVVEESAAMLHNPSKIEIQQRYEDTYGAVINF